MHRKCKTLVAYKIWKVKRPRSRQCHIRPIFKKRNVLGESQLVLDLREDPYYHQRYFRMDKSSFDEVLQRIISRIKKNSTHSRPITPMQRLSITLRYLATGNPQISLSLSYRVSPAAVSNILRETLTAIIEEFKEEYLPTPTEDTWKMNEKGFREKWNYPNAIGALDGKHCRIKCPAKSASVYYNYKSFFSIVLLAIVNANYEFTLVNIGASGSQSDSGILMRSHMGKSLEDQTVGLPPPKPITDEGYEILPHVILGDEGLPLKSYMMRPFSGKYLPEDERIFNYRLSRARLVVEDAFGILSARWRIFQTVIEADVQLVKLIVTTTVILHNFLRKKGDDGKITASTDLNGKLVEGNWRTITANDDGLLPLNRQSSNNHTFDSATIRNKFKLYFNSEKGELTWQKKHVNGF